MTGRRARAVLGRGFRAASLASTTAFVVLLSSSALSHAAAAGPEGRPAEIVQPSEGAWQARPALSGGSLDTAFTLQLPPGAACSGDSTNGGYRVQSFMVTADVDPSTLTFGANGPKPPTLGAGFRQPLYSVSTKSYVNSATNLADSPGGEGTIINIPNFDFGVFEPGDLPPGRYRLGLACTRGPASEEQLDRYWVTELEIAGGSGGAGGATTWVNAAAPSSSAGPVAGGGDTVPGEAVEAGDAAADPVDPAATDAAQPSTVVDGAIASDSPLPSGAAATAEPTGGPPTFQLPARQIAASLSVTGSVTGSLGLWAAIAVVAARVAVLLTRPLAVSHTTVH